MGLQVHWSTRILKRVIENGPDKIDVFKLDEYVSVFSNVLNAGLNTRGADLMVHWRVVVCTASSCIKSCCTDARRGVCLRLTW